MSEVVKMAIVGAGSVKCAPPVIASIATYFGERPLEVSLFDGDEERLDLMDRLARHCCLNNKAPHTVLYRPDLAEALEDAERVVLQVDGNCATKYLSAARAESADWEAALVAKALAKIAPYIPKEADVLSLQGKDAEIPLEFYRRLEWPPEPTEEEVRWMPHQIMRWLRGEEMLYDLFGANEKSPFRAWLDDPTAAELVLHRDS